LLAASISARSLLRLATYPATAQLEAVCGCGLDSGTHSRFPFFTMRKKLTAARLIVENQILHIQPAVQRVRNSMKESEAESLETVEMFCVLLWHPAGLQGHQI
jgi:hypothetical protein